MAHFMRENRDYEMSLDELTGFLNVTRQSNYKLDLIICGGEPLLWQYLKPGLKMIHESGIAGRVLIFSNVMDISKVDDVVMEYVTQLRISRYECNGKNTQVLQERYPDKVRIVERTIFYRQPSEPLPNVLPCECVNQEFLYMKGKVYACAHGASRNKGKDVLEDGTPLFVDLAPGYLTTMAEIRAKQEAWLCTKCSSNLHVREVCDKFKKVEQGRASLI
jgi:hypothetical protein